MKLDEIVLVNGQFVTVARRNVPSPGRLDAGRLHIPDRRHGARPPGMNALADRLRTMNGAWLEGRWGYSVRLVRANILDAEPHS